MEINQILNDIHIISKEPLCFTLNFKKYEKMSSHYYNPEILNLLRKLDTISNTVTLGDVSEKIIYSVGKWELHTSDYVPEDYPNSVLLLQALNLSENGIIRTKHDKYIKYELHTKWKNSQAKTNDIIMIIAGIEIGLSVLIPKNFPDANLNQNLARIVLRKEIDNKKIKIDPEFVLLYINSLYGRLQLNRLGGSRAVQSGLSTTEIDSIKMPFLSYERQRAIVEEVNKIKDEAENKLKKYKESLQKSRNLLNEIIGIKQKKFNNFFVLNKELIQDRLDYYFYSPNYIYIKSELEKLDKSKIEIVKGGEFTIMKTINKKELGEMKTRSFKYVDIGNTDIETNEITGAEEDILLNLPTRARQLAKTDDVMLPRPIGSTDGIVIVPEEYNNQLFSTGFIQVRPKNIKDSFLFWVVFKSEIVQEQFFYLQSGSIQPEITPTNFIKYVLIPIPKEHYKEEIIYDAKKYIEEAKYYRIEYKDWLERAKQTFIDMTFETT